jgi:hypothetical protein
MYTRLHPARPIRITPLASMPHKPSHRLHHTHKQPTSPLHPSASNSTPPCPSKRPTMCFRLCQPLSQAGLGVWTSTSSESRRYRKCTLPVGPWLVLRGAKPLQSAFRVVRRRLVGTRVRQVCLALAACVSFYTSADGCFFDLSAKWLAA